MAARTNKVEVQISATDDATPTIDRLERKIDGLEADEARITVTANTDRLQKQLDDAKAKLDGLDGDEASVQLRAIGNLETSLDQAQTLLRSLDGQTGTVHINAVDRASDDLDKVGDKVRQLDGNVARVGATGKIAAGVAGGIGVAAIGGSLLDALTTAHQLAGEVQQVADATGAPLDQASRLVTVWRNNGLEVGDLLDIIFQVNQTLQQQPDLAKQLGVNIADNQSLIDTFLQSVDGVATKYETVSERQIAASTLFGEEGVRQIGAVTTAVGDLDDAMSDLPKAALIDEEDVDRWRQANTEVTEFKQHLQEIQLTLSEYVLPLINGFLSGLESFYAGVYHAGQGFGDFIRNQPNYSGTDIARGIQGVVVPDAGPRVSNLPAGINDTVYGPPATRQGPIITIVNPPGTPPATADQLRLYDQRNGSR